MCAAAEPLAGIRLTAAPSHCNVSWYALVKYFAI